MVDTVRARCPDVDARDRDEAQRVTPRPAHWPADGARRRELQAHVDTLDADVAIKNAALDRVLGDYDRCRRAATKPSAPQS